MYERSAQVIHCGHSSIFLEEILREITGIILNNLFIVLTIFLQVKQDDKNNTTEIFKGKQMTHIFLVFYTMQWGGQIHDNSASLISLFPEEIEINVRSVRMSKVSKT